MLAALETGPFAEAVAGMSRPQRKMTAAFLSICQETSNLTQKSLFSVSALCRKWEELYGTVIPREYAKLLKEATLHILQNSKELQTIAK